MEPLSHIIAYQNKKHTFNWLNSSRDLHYSAIQTGMTIYTGIYQWKWYCPRLRQYHFHFSSYHDPWTVCISWILPSISVTIIYVNEWWLPLTKYGELDRDKNFSLS